MKKQILIFGIIIIVAMTVVSAETLELDRGFNIGYGDLNTDTWVDNPYISITTDSYVYLVNSESTGGYKTFFVDKTNGSFLKLDAYHGNYIDGGTDYVIISKIFDSSVYFSEANGYEVRDAVTGALKCEIGSDSWSATTGVAIDNTYYYYSRQDGDGSPDGFFTLHKNRISDCGSETTVASLGSGSVLFDDDTYLYESRTTSVRKYLKSDLSTVDTFTITGAFKVQNGYILTNTGGVYDSDTGVSVSTVSGASTSIASSETRVYYELTTPELTLNSRDFDGGNVEAIVFEEEGTPFTLNGDEIRGIAIDEANNELVIVTFNQSSGEPDSYSWVYVFSLTPPCTPSWVCSGYEVCDRPAPTTDCNAVTDENTCGETYTGDYTEFSTQVCTYSGGASVTPEPSRFLEKEVEESGEEIVTKTNAFSFKELWNKIMNWFRNLFK